MWDLSHSQIPCEAGMCAHRQSAVMAISACGPTLYPKWLSLDPSPLTPCHPSILRGKNKENDVRSSGTVFNVESAG
jgi:hypothetical protein